MRKIISVLLMIMFLVFSISPLSYSYEGETNDRPSILKKHLDHLTLEQANVATDMIVEIYELILIEPIENFSKDNLQTVLDKVFAILDKYNERLPLITVNITVWGISEDCSIIMDVFFIYIEFDMTISFFVHKIKKIEPKCPEKQPDTVA